jgi:predicted 3-demethylubiquinone-9 3-methyltransferase (glyoxalase superfamily)
MPKATITPFLWFSTSVTEPIAYYKSIFPDTKVEMESDFIGIFELQGQRFYALNGGPQFKFNESVSFFLSVDTQDEVNRYWNALTASGGEESMCGWLKDKYGLSWQVIPRKLVEYQGSRDRAAADRANQAMLKMRKIVIADLDKAFAGK